MIVVPSEAVMREQLLLSAVVGEGTAAGGPMSAPTSP